MSNELIFLISALVDIGFVFFAARRGVSWLIAVIVVNLLLVSIFGAKLIEVFGFVTNAGNVFYASVFLATHFILERHGKRDGFKTVWFGVSFLIFFVVMTQLTAKFVGLPLSESSNNAIYTLFGFTPRVAIASVLAFMFAQYVNICVYEWIKLRTKGKQLWLRVNGANIAAQLVDSLLFFSIAFIDLSGPLLVQTILVGWVVKTVVVLMGTPAIYINAFIEGRKS